MINSIDTKHLPIKDLIISGLIIFIMSTIIANIYNPLWGFTYAFGNVLTLVFLSWPVSRLMEYKSVIIDKSKMFFFNNSFCYGPNSTLEEKFF